jgi:hypothetical protein
MLSLQAAYLLQETLHQCAIKRTAALFKQQVEFHSTIIYNECNSGNSSKQHRNGPTNVPIKINSRAEVKYLIKAAARLKNI